MKRLQILLREQQKFDRELARVEQNVGHILREEETSCASHARRLQTCAEAKDSLQRMQRNPGVSFLGYESRAKQRISDMEKAIAEHKRPAKIAKERYELAKNAGKRAREQLRTAQNRYANWQHEHQLQIDPRILELALRDTQRELEGLVQSLSEAEIDEAVMNARVKPKDAARVRTALRKRPSQDLVR